MPQIVLYGSRLSPFVEKVAQALEYKKLPYTVEDIKSPGDLKKWNPVTGKMPVIEIDGEKVYDSTFILRRLDEIQPEPPLFSEDPAAAAQQRLLEDWADESLYWHIMALRWNERNRDATIAQITASIPSFLRPVARIIVSRGLGKTPAAQGLGRLPHDVLVRECGKAFDDLVLLLGGKPFFFADRPGAADFAIYGELQAATSGPTPEFDELLSDRPALADFRKRVEDAVAG